MSQDLQAELPERFLPLDLGRHRSLVSRTCGVGLMAGQLLGAWSLVTTGKRQNSPSFAFAQASLRRFRVRWVHSPNRFGQQTAQLCSHRVLLCTRPLRQVGPNETLMDTACFCIFTFAIGLSSALISAISAAARTASLGARYFRSHLQLGAFAPSVVKIRRPATAAKSNSGKKWSENFAAWQAYCRQ